MPKTNKKKDKPGFLRFLISRAFLVNLLLSIVFVFVLVWLTLGFISRYSQHSESQTVPELIGMPAQEAANLLKRSGLDYAVMDSSYQHDAEPISILSQEPKAGSLVKNGRTIYVVINRQEPPPTKIPYIEQGTSFISVQEILESQGLVVGHISYKPFQYKDVFLDMRIRGSSNTPTTGMKVSKGTIIDLTLGNGLGDTKVEIPDVTGLSYMEALALIQLKELNVGTIIIDGTIIDTLSSFIVRQLPAASEDGYINMGSMIDLWISNTAPVTDEFQDEEINDN